MEINKDDQKLVELAIETLSNNKNLYPEQDLIVASAVRAKSGKVYKGVNIKTSHSVCAEQVAIGQALTCGERELDTIVAVKFDRDLTPRIVSPCGLCRYIMDKMDLGLNVLVIDKNDMVIKVDLNELLPYPYNRNS